jgi:hypothetical protein
MGDYWTNEVRHPEDTGIGHIRRTVKFGTPNTDANGVCIGALEAGAVPLFAHVTIVTAFNAGTTNSLIVGTSADDDGYATTAAVLPGATGFKGNLSGALSGIPMAANTPVYAKYAQTGTAATAGEAIVILTFINKRDEPGRTFPNNP